MKTDNLNKYLLSAIAFLLVSIGFVLFLYRQISINIKVTDQIEAQWASEIETQEKIKELELSVSQILEERTSFESHFVRNSDIVTFLDTIEQLATNVSAKAIISTVDTAQDPPSLLVGIRASGSFEALYKFMMLIENAPYELEIESFDLRKEGSVSDSDTFKPEWSVTLRVNVLSFSK